MGGAIARLTGRATRPARNFNVEERAFKVISKDKPTPAPTHARMQAILDEIKNDPQLLIKDKLDPKTLEHLSKVYIKSEGDNPVVESKNKRKLPQERKGVEDYEYGYEDPPNIPKGKVSMRQILELLDAYEANPDGNSPDKLAQKYNISQTDVENLLKYFKPFQVILPKKKDKSNEPKIPGLKLLQQKMDRLKE